MSSIAQKTGCKIHDEAGFTKTELLVTVLIALTLTTIALPNMANIVADTRLRATINTVSGILQDCRTIAVKNNRTMTTHLGTASERVVGYVKLATDTGDPVSSDPQVELEARISRYTTPNEPLVP